MSLFHSPEFVALNDLRMVVVDGARLLIGPERGTYGGFADAYDLRTMEGALAVAPLYCTIKLAPASHDLALFSRSMNAMLRAGFKVEHVDLNYERKPLNINFEEGLSDGARKKLAKCRRAGFQSRILEREEWPQGYLLINSNRIRAGRELSIPYERITELENALPGTHLFFGTFDGPRMVAAAITLRVRPDVLYTWAWGDAEKSEFSPTTHLCERIYEEACFMSCRLLDIGTSTVNGVPDAGLIAYKSSLGFECSAKVTMRRA